MNDGERYSIVNLRSNVRQPQLNADAGADCLYAPRINSIEDIAAIIAAVAPKPVNLLINSPFITVDEAAALGVRRISVGGTLARPACGAFLEVARVISEFGTFSDHHLPIAPAPTT